MPKVSVIMGIYNCATTLLESVESILAQTYSDWELIMCDDGSTDDTYTVALSYSETHNNIFVFQNEKNMGLNYTLNRCLQQAGGEYIARMDGDDISLPHRFEKEVCYLEDNPDIAFVSAPMEYFDENGVWGRGFPKEAPKPIDFVKASPFCHAPCMIRKTAYNAIEGYTVDKRLLRVEDYHLWLKLYTNGFKGVNLTVPLYRMRDDRNATNRRKFKYRLNEMYVKLLICRSFSLPIRYYVFALRPLLIGLLPNRIYSYLHKNRLKVSLLNGK